MKGKEGDIRERNTTTRMKEPAKFMCYFPIIPGLKIVYMSPKIVEQMRWHDRDRVKDGKLRHPTDAIT